MPLRLAPLTSDLPALMDDLRELAGLRGPWTISRVTDLLCGSGVTPGLLMAALDELSASGELHWCGEVFCLSAQPVQTGLLPRAEASP